MNRFSLKISDLGLVLGPKDLFDTFSTSCFLIVDMILSCLLIKRILDIVESFKLFNRCIAACTFFGLLFALEIYFAACDFALVPLKSVLHSQVDR